MVEKLKELNPKNSALFVVAFAEIVKKKKKGKIFALWSWTEVVSGFAVFLN